MRDKDLKHANDNFISYLQGRFQNQLEGYAIGTGIPFRELAERMGNFLLGAASGGALGSFDRVSPLRGKTAKGDSTARKMAMDDNPRRRKASQKKAHSYWSKLSKAERREEMQRRRKIGQQRKEAA